MTSVHPIASGTAPGELPRVNLPNTAREIYETVRDLPIVSPHGHCDPSWFSTNAAFADPAELLIIPDHYVFRMLYSQGVDLRSLGIGVRHEDRDPRSVFSIFAAHWYKFVGTPSHLWLSQTLETVFGITESLTPANADRLYDLIAAALPTPALQPRALFEAFNIEFLATTDGALDDLACHDAIRQDGWAGRIVPTFRPDTILNPALPQFAGDVRALASVTGVDTTNLAGYLNAIRARRTYFKARGATATDHDVPDLKTRWLPRAQAEALYAEALTGDLSQAGAQVFYGHMLTEMAQMSVDDGLVMQIHAGSRRSTNQELLKAFGRDMGADIPHRTDWVDGLDALLNRVGNDPDLTVILFTLDETGYTRELAPMAGHWPALRLGPPWWFHDSLNGIARYLDQTIETAGYWNLAGFNDDTRAFLSIPARHDLWRRGISLHLEQQVNRGLFSISTAGEIARLLARDLAVDAYNIPGL